MMKKNAYPLAAVLLAALLLTAFLGGCASPAASAEADPLKEVTLESCMESLLDGVDELPMVQNIELTDELFPSFAFIDMPEGGEGLASEGMISSIAHSVVLVRFADADAAKSGAEAMQANANPTKWICVTAEKTIVKRSGSVVLLVMSFEKTADAIAANFDALTK